MDRHQKDDSHDGQDEAEFSEGENAVGNHLADHQTERGDGRHGELLQRAAFALAHQAERDQQDDHHLQKNGDEAGHKEVCRARGRVVEHRRAHLDGHRAMAEDAAQRLLPGRRRWRC